MNRKDLLPLAIKERDKIRKHIKAGNMGNYTLIFEDGNVSPYMGMICYHMLSGKPKAPIAFIADLETKHKEEFESYEVEYTDWWINESFAANAFITKDPSEALEKGVVLKAEYPAGYVIIAGMGLRYIYEKPHIVRAWTDFKEYVSPDIAIILAHKFRKAADKKGWSSGISGGEGHTWLGEYLKNEELRRIINHDFFYFKNMSPLRESMSFLPIGKIWCVDKAGLSSSYIRGDFRFPEGKEETLSNSWGGTRTVTVYKSNEMRSWLTESVLINGLKIKKG